MVTLCELLNRKKEIDKEARLKYVDGQILQRMAYANFWTIYAASDANKARIVVNGNGVRKTSLELEESAFETAQQHIRLIEELNDARDKIIRGE